jgi:hypothetical protein
MQSFKRAQSCTKNWVVGLIFAGLVGTGFPAHAEWSIDFSRRNLKTRERDLNAVSRSERQPAAVHGGQRADQGAHSTANEVVDTTAKAIVSRGVLDSVFDAGEPIQDMVILLTDKGFTPSTLRVRKGGRYRIHVVNVNEREKNVSFILDGFSEHHAIYYGKIKVFVLEPKKDGAYSFQSPETSSEGKLIVFNAQLSVRSPASEE